MNTKTIKLQKDEYTDLKEEFNQHDILILTGARGSGKSYPTAKHISKLLLQDVDAKFIYMRIHDRELATFSSWCMDMDLCAIADYADTTKLVRGTPTRGDIMLYGYDQNGAIMFSRVIGKCISLESSHEFKSGKYDEFKYVVFEEYTHLNMNPETEKRYVFNFLENVVSIFRNRDKHIVLMCNNLKTIPLLETAIDQLTGEIFKNPLKIKIFRQNANNKSNKFLAYLNGENYQDEDFTIRQEEFYILYSNKKYVIKQHKVFNHKHYVTENKNKTFINYSEIECMNLKFFCRAKSVNEFYFPSTRLEHMFTSDYFDVMNEIINFLSTHGSRYILNA